MRKNLYSILFTLAASCLTGTMLQSCSEDEYTSTGDLFQPRFAADPAVDTLWRNKVTMAWYEVNNAKSYTVRVFNDNYYTDLFMEKEVTDPGIIIDDIPYNKKFYVMVRTNAQNEANNSQWATTGFTTLKRRDFPQLLQEVETSDITKTTAVIRWTGSHEADEYVDSISVVPTTSTTAAPMGRMLTEEEKAQGFVNVSDLLAGTDYTVTIYNSTVERKYDRPYNVVYFSTVGEPAQTIYVNLTDDFSALLAYNNDNDAVPENSEYILPAGSTYTISPFKIKKGFTIRGEEGGEKPHLICNGSWNFAENSHVKKFEMINLKVSHKAEGQYFVNADSPFQLQQATFTNVDFVGLTRGFWRHKNENEKIVKNIIIDGCIFDKCTQPSGSYGFIYLEAAKNEANGFDDLQNVTIKNTTLCRSIGRNADGTKAYDGWTNLIQANKCNNPMNIKLSAVTIYDYCPGKALINIDYAEGSTLTVERLILASGCSLLLNKKPAQLSATYRNNFATSEYSRTMTDYNGINCSSSAADIFANPANGDYTLNPANADAQLMIEAKAGDPRWIK